MHNRVILVMKWVNIARISKFLEFSGRKKYPGGSRCRDIVVAAQIRPKKTTLLFQKKIDSGKNLECHLGYLLSISSLQTGAWHLDTRSN